MEKEIFDHGLPNNPYNKHAWVVGHPEIGERVWIGAFCLIDAGHSPLKIGRGTDISSGVQILTHSTLTRCISERRHGDIETSPTEIGEFCFIGTHATILMGAKIGHHSVIAAGAVVPQFAKIPPYSILAGVPAKIIGSSKKFLKNVEKESISVVIPAYNEEETVEQVVKEAFSTLAKISKDYEVVLIDDGSTDKTGKIIDRIARQNKRIRGVHHKQNMGFTGAMRTSFTSAKKHLVFLAPADGQFDFSQLKNFIEAIKGYDVAIGYRVENEEDIIRKINSRLFHLVCKILLNIHFKEISSVSLWRRRVIQSIEVVSEDRSAMFLPEVTSKALRKKYRFVEVPLRWGHRRGGESKGANPRVIVKTLIQMLRLWYTMIRERT